MANIDVKLFHIVTHSYVASFWIKTSFVKLTTFSSAKKTKKEAKPIREFESKSKIKVRSRWTFFNILLMSVVIWI